MRGRPRYKPMGIVDISDQTLAAEVEFAEPLAIRKTLAFVALSVDKGMLVWHFTPSEMHFWADSAPIVVKFDPNQCHRYCSQDSFAVCVHPQNLLRVLKQIDSHTRRVRIIVPKIALRPIAEDFTDTEEEYAIVMELTLKSGVVRLQIPLSCVPPAAAPVVMARELATFEMGHVVLRKLINKHAAVTVDIKKGIATILSQDPKLGTARSEVSVADNLEVNCKFSGTLVYHLLGAREAEKIGIRIYSKWVEIIHTMANNTVFVQLPALVLNEKPESEVPRADGGCQACVMLASEVRDSSQADANS